MPIKRREGKRIKKQKHRHVRKHWPSGRVKPAAHIGTTLTVQMLALVAGSVSRSAPKPRELHCITHVLPGMF